jgi:hypothetical protein
VKRSSLTIVSGGQTGVDRGALDAAMAAGIHCGGWCPRGRRAEDGVIPAGYPLNETSSSDYEQRTRLNVEQSDATLVIEFSAASPGTRLTQSWVRRAMKPLLLIDALADAPESAVAVVLDFVQSERVRVLNVAGPRASEAPGAYTYARELVSGLIAALPAQEAMMGTK